MLKNKTKDGGFLKINDLQLKNFLKICKKNGEFFPGDKTWIRTQLESVLEQQGYWSGFLYRYYLDGDDWRTEERQFGG